MSAAAFLSSASAFFGTRLAWDSVLQARDMELMGELLAADDHDALKKELAALRDGASVEDVYVIAARHGAQVWPFFFEHARVLANSKWRAGYAR